MLRSVDFVIPEAFAKASKGVFTTEHIETAKKKLALNPELGDMIPKTGGARKIWQTGIGRQSRLIYYFHSGAGRIYFIACYPKSRQKDLTEKEKEALKAITKGIREKEKGRRI